MTTMKARRRQSGPVAIATAAPIANGIPRLENASAVTISTQATTSPRGDSRRSASSIPIPAAIEPK